jgi:hypothetical protein
VLATEMRVMQSEWGVAGLSAIDSATLFDAGSTKIQIPGLGAPVSV